ncbi:solute carrier family 35 member B1-like [Tetranychus urticae]|uniref:solute carrier family 35 member B1-like n=1 Tax=Tetranychus urticae TaxID=32264 RepID=UPI000D64F842|nr:solute carrier family 35 member B1-like [Tetranychus urticae]
MKHSNDKPISVKPIQGNNTLKLIICALGIFVCYFYYGLLQEKITRSKYGSDDEKFVYPMCLVLCQCIVNAILAQIRKLSHSQEKLASMYKDKPSSSTVADKPLLGWGEILLLLYLTMDGLTGAIQERVKSKHKTQSWHMTSSQLSFIILMF